MRNASKVYKGVEYMKMRIRRNRSYSRSVSVTNEYWNIHPSTVRSILKKGGFNVGFGGMNGRIKGYAQFFGDIEIQKLWIGNEGLPSDMSYSKRPIHYFNEYFGVEVRSHEGTDLKLVKDYLESAGYIVSFNHDKSSLVLT